MSKTILCVIDDSPELKAAVHYACLMAKRDNADIGLLYCIEPEAFQQWKAVKALMREENRAEAEGIMQKWGMVVEGLTGMRPTPFVREGAAKEQLLELLEEEADVKHLVLAAADHPDNPGALVSRFAGKIPGSLRIPVTVVPGKLSGKEIEALF